MSETNNAVTSPAQPMPLVIGVLDIVKGEIIRQGEE